MNARDRIPTSVLFAIATGFGVSSTVQAYWLQRLSSEGGWQWAGLPQLLALNLVYWYVPAISAPFIMAIATRYQLGRVRWRVQMLVHVPGALAYAAVHSAVMLATRAVLFPNGMVAKGSCWRCVARESLQQLDWLLMTYLFLVGLAHALAYRREAETRALNASQLEMRLVEAQLQALQRQLHPHFLFNTLNAISGLMRSNLNAADLMIDQLGDLLRMTLETSGAQQVSLKDELEVLQKYLEIEQTRFGGRLSIAMHVEPETLDALVPNLLLQPLVENAVRHGIAPHARPGWIVIDATRAGRQLAIEIRDSGDGLPPDRLVALNRRRPRHHARAPGASVSIGLPVHVLESQGRLLRVGPHPVAGRAGGGLRVRGGRMTMIRTLVIDDEPIARSHVIALLREESDIEVVGECANGAEAAGAIAEVSPDLLFLDVQMPELNGLELMRVLGQGRAPAVVFVTAYDQYALRAFEVHAIDYLLKPFSAERFKSALTHARAQLAQRRATTLGRELMDLLPEMRRPPGRDRLVVKSSGRIYFVRTADIDWCEAAGNYVRLHVGQQTHLMRDTMAHVELNLDPNTFIRIHRSAIVNVDRIEELQSSFNGEYVVLLRGGTRLTLSRGYREGLQTRLGKSL